MDCSVQHPEELKKYAMWQLHPTPTLYPLSGVSQFGHVGSCADVINLAKFNLIGSGVSEPQVAENRYLPLTGGITLTTVYTLTCYTVIKPCKKNPNLKPGFCIFETQVLHFQNPKHRF